MCITILLHAKNSFIFRKALAFLYLVIVHNHSFNTVCVYLNFSRIHLKRKATEQSGGTKKKQKKSGKQKSSQRKPAMKRGGKNKKQFTKKR